MKIYYKRLIEEVVFILIGCTVASYFLLTSNAKLAIIVLSIVFIDTTLSLIFKIELKVRFLFYTICLYMFSTYLSVQPNASEHQIKLVSNLINIVLFFSPVVLFIHSRFKINKEIISLLCFIVAFLCVNFFGLKVTYGHVNLFVQTSKDYLRFFCIIFYLMLSRFNRKDFTVFLYLCSIFTILNFFLACCQFFGSIYFFDIFRGTYSIVSRNGLYRAIGFFSYPIELANFSMVMFCFFYFFNKYTKSNKYFYIISLLAIMNILLTGTRMTILAVLVVFVLDNCRTIKSFIYSATGLIGIYLLSNKFFDYVGMVDSVKSEYAVEKPRIFYFLGGLKVFKYYPIFGIGFNTFGREYYRIKTDDFIYQKFNLNKWDNAKLKSTDIFYAQLFPEFGILGLIVILLFCYYVAKLYFEIVKEKKYVRSFLYVIIACLIGAFNSSSILFNLHVGIFFWISIGMIITFYCDNKE